MQLPQLRHRDATSSQRAAPWLAAISSRRPAVGIGAAHPLRRPGDGGPRPSTAASPAGTCGTPASTSAPAAVPTSTRKRCRSPATSSVSARSYPGPAPGGAHGRAEAGLARLGAVHRHDEHGGAAGPVPRVAGPLPSTRSWIWIARRSQGRTPKNASRGGAVVIRASISKPPSARLADQSFSRGGCRNCFHELRPGRVTERGAVGAAPQPVAAGLQPDAPPEGQFRGGASSPSTIAPSRTVGPMTDSPASCSDVKSGPSAVASIIRTLPGWIASSTASPPLCTPWALSAAGPVRSSRHRDPATPPLSSHGVAQRRQAA